MVKSRLSYISALAMLICGCAGQPSTMLEFYYSVPFGDKYSEVLSKEAKEKLIDIGQWQASEDSSYAHLTFDNQEEQYSGEIVIRTWDSGNIAAVTTYYDEGSDCPPINQLYLFRYDDGWKKIELPPITIDDYWSDADQAPGTAGEITEIAFEPFLEETLSGVRLHWRRYVCSAGDSYQDQDHDLEKDELDRKIRAALNQRDFDDVFVVWNAGSWYVEKPSSTRDKTAELAGFEIEPDEGLLLGALTNDGPVTHFVTFGRNDIRMKTLVGAILTPQADKFYLVQHVSQSETKECSYEEDGQQLEDNCTHSETLLLVSQAASGSYARELGSIREELGQRLNAECGLTKDNFERITWVGRNFIQYTKGGSDGECAPGGPGGGFEKDTIKSFDGTAISMLAGSYLNEKDLEDAYSGLFSPDHQSNSFPGLCKPEEMLINLVHTQGRLRLIVRNTVGRNYQDSWEKEIDYTDAPSQFQSKKYADVGNKDVFSEASDYYVSPSGKYAAVINKTNDAANLHFYNLQDPNVTARTSFVGASVVMEEWCEKGYWSKWDRAVEDAARYVELQSPE